MKHSVTILIFENYLDTSASSSSMRAIKIVAGLLCNFITEYLRADVAYSRLVTSDWAIIHKFVVERLAVWLVIIAVKLRNSHATLRLFHVDLVAIALTGFHRHFAKMSRFTVSPTANQQVRHCYALDVSLWHVAPIG